MYKFDATLLIAGVDHPATVTYNAFYDAATVEFKTGERADSRPCNGVKLFLHAPWNGAKLFLHAEIDGAPDEGRGTMKITAQDRRNAAGLALEAAGWIVEQF